MAALRFAPVRLAPRRSAPSILTLFKTASVKSQPLQQTPARSRVKHAFTAGRMAQQHGETSPGGRGQHVAGHAIVQSPGAPPPGGAGPPSSPHPALMTTLIAITKAKVASLIIVLPTFL